MKKWSILWTILLCLLFSGCGDGGSSGQMTGENPVVQETGSAGSGTEVPAEKGSGEDWAAKESGEDGTEVPAASVKPDGEATETEMAGPAEHAAVYLSHEEEERSVHGSGFIAEMTAEKVYICTSRHVVAGYEDWQVFFWDGTAVSGTVSGVSELYDVGVVEVDRAAIPEETGRNLTRARIDLAVWEEVRDNGQNVPIRVFRLDKTGLTDEVLSGSILNIYEDFAWGNGLRHTRMDIILQPGDSGSAVLGEDGCLLSMVYGTSYDEDKPKRWGIPLSAVLSSYEEITGRSLGLALE